MAKKQNTFSCKEISFEEYDNLITPTSHSLYFSPWWLSTIQANIKEGNFLFYLISRKDEEVALFVALYQHKQIVTADYCQHLGLHYLVTDLTLHQKQEVCLSLHSSLPKHFYFHLNFSPKEVDWLAWHWQGYKQTTRYNYILPIQELDTMEQFMCKISKKNRQNIKANIKKGFYYDTEIDQDEAICLFEQNAKRKDYIINLTLIQHLVNQSKEDRNIDLVGIRDNTHFLVLVALLIKHQDRAYILTSGSEVQTKGHNLKTFLLINYIIKLDDSIKLFDFEGSMIEPVAKIAQSMGAIQEPYFTIKKGNRYAPTILLSKTIARLKNLQM